jgi:hypothetical protein
MGAPGGQLRWYEFEALFAFCDLHASRVGGLPSTERPMYFDRQGFPIPAKDADDPHGTLGWAELHKEKDYCRIAWDDLPDGGFLSTVWIGIDHRYGIGCPQIFETMRFAANVTEGHYEMSGRVRTYKTRQSLEFEDPTSGEQTEQLRYMTEEEALATHHEIVRRLRLREGH